ncbi:MAG: polymer-forming cytoskeletal protein [Alphaproteobacteria bacterium]|nr:polymer-forming cytoskeletal protein [Alphaproteobacteria bacterium]
MTDTLAGLLGPGARYTGDLVFHGRVRIDGTFVGTIRSDDLLEIGPTGTVKGEIDVAQALVAGRMDGTLKARERCTVLPTARIDGRLTTPWLDLRPGARVHAEVVVQRADADD